LLVRNHTPGLAVRYTSTDRLHHVQVVMHIVQAAIVWQTIKEGTNGVFGGHGNLTSRAIPVYGQRVMLLITRARRSCHDPFGALRVRLEIVTA
jgi:hypothetical protein